MILRKQVTNDEAASLRSLVPAIVADMAPLVLGRVSPAWQCCCGAIKHGEAVAVAMEPSIDYPAQTPCFGSWSVRMKEHGETGAYSYSCGLTDFVTRPELDTIFDRHFRAWMAAHRPDDLMEAERRLAPGGDLHGLNHPLWF